MEPQGWDALGAPQPASPAPAAAGLDKWPCRLQISCLVGTCRTVVFHPPPLNRGLCSARGACPALPTTAIHRLFTDEAPSRQYAAPQLQLLLS